MRTYMQDKEIFPSNFVKKYSEALQLILTIGVVDKNLLNIRDKVDRQILHCSAMMGDIENMERLLNMGADGNGIVNNFFGNTPLHWTIANCRPEAACFLVRCKNKYSIDLNIADKNGNTPLHLAVMKGWNRVDDEKRDRTPLKNAITLLAENSTPNVQNKLGNTPLHYAILHRNVECIEKLISCGARLDTVNCKGKTPVDMINTYYAKTQQILYNEIGSCYTLMSQTAWRKCRSDVEEILLGIQNSLSMQEKLRLYNTLEPIYERIDNVIPNSQTTELTKIQRYINFSNKFSYALLTYYRRENLQERKDLYKDLQNIINRYFVNIEKFAEPKEWVKNFKFQISRILSRKIAISKMSNNFPEFNQRSKKYLQNFEKAEVPNLHKFSP